jgi:hypothetical protein
MSDVPSPPAQVRINSRYAAFIPNRNSGQRSRFRGSAIQGDHCLERKRNTAPLAHSFRDWLKGVESQKLAPFSECGICHWVRFGPHSDKTVYRDLSCPSGGLLPVRP